MNTGPKTKFSQSIHAEKYRAKGESFKEATSRIAGALTKGKEEFHKFRDILRFMRYMPGGRIQSAVGSPKAVTPFNCFVSGTIEDSFVDGKGSIMARATEAAQTMRMGGGIGYDFSTLRPRGAKIKKLGSVSSGPVSFMGIYDAICQCVASSGHRRGAQMGVLRVDHPDIEEFIHVKQREGKLAGFNISIGITNEFMRAVETGMPFRLVWGGDVFSEIDASALWEKIMRSTWEWAEPGVIFLDTINEMNNLWYAEHIAAMNPCGEQPLPPFGACLLGSFNLSRYLEYNTVAGFSFNFEQLTKDIPQVVRSTDAVIDLATFPLEAQRQEALNKRRMGLGITGLANAGETLGLPYGSPAFIEFERKVLTIIRDECYRASALLAKERGAFPLFDKEKYLSGKFIQTLPKDVLALIEKYGLRNSHLLSIAPTGTISITADNCSSGIEPVFARSTERTVQTFDGPIQETVEDYAFAKWGVIPKECRDVTAEEHLAVLATATELVDSAVSKTCNVSPDMPWSEFKNLYMKAWKLGCKGVTTFNEGGKRMGILKKGSSCKRDEKTGRMECE